MGLQERFLNTPENCGLQIPLLFSQLIDIIPKAGLQSQISFILPLITQFLLLNCLTMELLWIISRPPALHIFGYYGQYTHGTMRSEPPE